MILWRNNSKPRTTTSSSTESSLEQADIQIEGTSHLLNIPFQPGLVHQEDTEELSVPNLIYTANDTTPTSPQPTAPLTDLNFADEYPWESIKHVFAAHGHKAKPVHVDVNGRKGRRAVCVLYGDSMRYEVLDLDAAIEEEEVEVEDEEQGEEDQNFSDEQDEVMDSDAEN